MAKRPPITLETLKAAKPSALVAAENRNRASAERRGQTLRLPVDQWRRLKVLAIDEGRTSHDLMLEALNMLFSSKGLPPLV